LQVATCWNGVYVPTVAARCRGYSKAEKTYTFIESLALFHKFNEHVHLLVNGFETFLSRCDDLGVAPRQNCRQKVFNVGVRLCRVGG